MRARGVGNFRLRKRGVELLPNIRTLKKGLSARAGHKKGASSPLERINAAAKKRGVQVYTVDT